MSTSHPSTSDKQENENGKTVKNLKKRKEAKDESQSEERSLKRNKKAHRTQEHTQTSKAGLLDLPDSVYKSVEESLTRRRNFVNEEQMTENGWDLDGFSREEKEREENEEKQRYPKLEVKEVSFTMRKSGRKVSDRGLFLKSGEKVKTNEVLCIYTGRFIREKEVNNKLYKQYQDTMRILENDPVSDNYTLVDNVCMAAFANTGNKKYINRKEDTYLDGTGDVPVPNCTMKASVQLADREIYVLVALTDLEGPTQLFADYDEKKTVK